jgi:hypothetical protein
MLNTNTLQNLLAFNQNFHNAVEITDKNYIASPLGAWLLLSCLAGGNPNNLSQTEREQLESYLSPVASSNLERLLDIANQLLSSSPDNLTTAVNAWIKPTMVSEHTDAWGRKQLNKPFNHLPTQVELDEWAKKNSLGLIEKFPLDVNPDVWFIFANVLATKIKWNVPFARCEVQSLRDEKRSAFSNHFGNVESLLLSGSSSKHVKGVFVDETDGELYVVVENTDGEGLVVSAVIAVNPSLNPTHVMGVAEEWFAELNDNLIELTVTQLVENHADKLGGVLNVSETHSFSDGMTVTLPAWEASSKHALSDFMPFAEASAVIGAGEGDEILAKQVAVAKYNLEGFEAAALSAVMAARTAMPPVKKIVEALYSHPFAVVAGIKGNPETVWNNVPVFTAWVQEACEVTGE